MASILNHFVIILLSILYTLHITDSNECVLSDVKRSLESKLKQDLLCNYDKNERPVKDHKDAVTVNVSLILKRFYVASSVFSDSPAITVYSWLLMSWKDEYLSWNPGEYGNINQVQISSSDIWLPGLTLFNGKYPSSADGRFDSICMLRSVGTIVCIPHVSHDALCKVNVKRWPFDSHNCTMILGAWMNTGEEVYFNIRNESISDRDFTPNPEWELISAKASRSIIGDCCPNRTYPQLKFTFELSRHNQDYSAVIFWPAVVMMFVNLTAVLIDFNNTERMILLAVNIICHFMFIQQIYYYVPRNGNDTPLIILFFRDSLIVTGFLLILTPILKAVAGFKVEIPIWIAKTNIAMNSVPGKIIMFNEFDPTSDTAAVLKDEENQQQAEPKDYRLQWRRIMLFISRLTFVAIVLVYAVLIIAFIPE